VKQYNYLVDITRSDQKNLTWDPNNAVNVWACVVSGMAGLQPLIALAGSGHGNEEGRGLLVTRNGIKNEIEDEPKMALK
jgi:hypothetical protein